MASKIVGIAIASTAFNGVLSLWLVALKRRFRKKLKEARGNQGGDDLGLKRTTSEGSHMSSMELLQSITWQQKPCSYTRPSAALEEIKYYSAVEEAAQLRALNKKLVAQIDQLEETLLTLSKRESSWKRVEELEEQLREANEMLAVLEAECEMMEAMAAKEGMIVRDSSIDSSAFIAKEGIIVRDSSIDSSLIKFQKSSLANLNGSSGFDDDDFLSPRTPDVTAKTRARGSD